jgi:hypothetical protein
LRICNITKTILYFGKFGANSCRLRAALFYLLHYKYNARSRLRAAPKWTRYELIIIPLPESSKPYFAHATNKQQNKFCGEYAQNACLIF